MSALLPGSVIILMGSADRILRGAGGVPASWCCWRILGSPSTPGRAATAPATFAPSTAARCSSRQAPWGRTLQFLQQEIMLRNPP